MASDAGLNRIGSLGGKRAFANNVTTASSTLTLGVNDTGPILLEAKGFANFLFQPIGTWGQGTATVVAYVLGTTDYTTSGDLAFPNNPPTTRNWFPLPTNQQSTGDAYTSNNPLQGNNASYAKTLQNIFTTGGDTITTVTDSLYVRTAGLVAVRIIVVPSGATGTAVNPNCNVLIFALE